MLGPRRKNMLLQLPLQDVPNTFEGMCPLELSLLGVCLGLIVQSFRIYDFVWGWSAVVQTSF